MSTFVYVCMYIHMCMSLEREREKKGDSRKMCVYIGVHVCAQAHVCVQSGYLCAKIQKILRPNC